MQSINKNEHKIECKNPSHQFRSTINSVDLEG